LLSRLQNAQSQYLSGHTEILRERQTLEEAILSLDVALKDTEDSIAKTVADIVEKEQSIERYEAE
jgi:septal ring factor EnvC (AmiA/AmiB activator)